MRFTEALFPGYVFARCDIEGNYRYLLSMQGIVGVVCYGKEIPPVPERFIDELRERMKSECYEMPEPRLQVGSEVVVTAGPFIDIEAIVSGHLPAVERVSLLLDFLGRQIQVDLPVAAVMAKKRDARSDLLAAS